MEKQKQLLLLSGNSANESTDEAIGISINLATICLYGDREGRRINKTKESDDLAINCDSLYQMNYDNLIQLFY